MTTLVYICSMINGTQHRMSGNFFYDYFMGAPLNPRIGPVDLKMWAETRVPWPVLFYISVSCLLKQYELTGQISAPQAFMVLAHFLYVNACQKGEECIPTSWDMFYEKDGKLIMIMMSPLSLTANRFHAHFLEHGWCSFYLLLCIHLLDQLSTCSRHSYHSLFALHHLLVLPFVGWLLCV